uniref:Uncharacterized protein n=1 Tax=Panagrolaimus sp. PS1159 TaxID=55785 RepID=A0AC35G7D2_9BILA
MPEKYSTGNLFSPVLISVKKPLAKCLNSLPLKVFLDYRSFEIFPKRQNHWERITNISVLNGNDAIFECHNFLHRGIYRFQVGNTIKEVSLNSTEIQPTVNFREDSIFPHCNGDFSLTWKLPDCLLPTFSTTQFRIRVLAILDGPEGLPEDWTYVEEFPALPPNSSALSSMATIPCSQFDIIYKKFCFELVSVDDKSHRVSEWDRRCVFTEPSKFFPFFTVFFACFI